MSDFEFFRARSLRKEHFEQCDMQEWLFEPLIAKGAISVVYGPSGSGKSWLALGVVAALVPKMRSVVYIDRENRLSDLKNRGVDDLIQTYENFFYMHRYTMQTDAMSMLVLMASKAANNYYRDTLIVLDGAKHFVSDIENDRHVMVMMEHVMRLRDDGATVLMLHHTNKSGANYQGSKELIDSADFVLSLSAIVAPARHVGVLVRADKLRGNEIESIGWQIDVRSLKLAPIDVRLSQLDAIKRALVNGVLEALKSSSHNASSLCALLGRDTKDKSVRALLDEFDGVLWQSYRGRSNALIYENYESYETKLLNKQKEALE